MAIAAAAISGGRQERNFFTAMATAMAVIVFAGFSRTFFLAWLYDKPSPYAPPETIFYVHGVFFAAWMGLLILQPSLIRFRRYNLHRQVGWFGAGLAAIMVVVGTWGLLVAAARPTGFMGPPTPPLPFLGVLIFNILNFAVLVGFAIAYRGQGQFHKRLMLLATVNLLQAAFVRIPLDFIENDELVSFLLPYIFILALAGWDFAAIRRIHPATLWGGLAIVATLPLRFWVSHTEAWLGLAGWAVGLVR